MEVGIQQREYESQLKQDRQEEAQQKTAGSTTMNEPPNIVITMLFLGLAIIGDIAGLIPVIGWVISYPILGFIWLWRFLRHQTGPKKDPTLQLLLSSLGRALPFVPTCSVLVLYTYGMDTKLGKETVGRAKKLTEPKKPNE
jgi:O-antigen/teichoic acid export membrane protein